jgi:hypothetical protein
MVVAPPPPKKTPVQLQKPFDSLHPTDITSKSLDILQPKEGAASENVRAAPAVICSTSTVLLLPFCMTLNSTAPHATLLLLLHECCAATTIVAYCLRRTSRSSLPQCRCRHANVQLQLQLNPSLHVATCLAVVLHGAPSSFLTESVTTSLLDSPPLSPSPLPRLITPL